MKRLFLWVCTLGVLGPLHAGHLDELRRQAEASMLLTGDITVSPQGTVSGYHLNHAEQVPVEVRHLLERSIPAWTFEPPQHEGQPVIAQAPMSLRVVARPMADGNFALSVGTTWFGEQNKPDEEGFGARRRALPIYPRDLIGERVSGTVYLLLDIGRDGEVRQVAAEQVDLDVIGEPAQMTAWRQRLAASAASAARRWIYNVPTRGPLAQDDHWIMRVPVQYALSGGLTAPVAYGRWAVYLPGPHNAVSWAGQAADRSADALPGDGVYAGKSALRRLLAQPGSTMSPPAGA